MGWMMSLPVPLVNAVYAQGRFNGQPPSRARLARPVEKMVKGLQQLGAAIQLQHQLLGPVDRPAIGKLIHGNVKQALDSRPHPLDQHMSLRRRQRQSARLSCRSGI